LVVVEAGPVKQLYVGVLPGAVVGLVVASGIKITIL
jgi:hypothetical protein